MIGISIRDKDDRGFLIPVSEVVQALGQSGLASRWRISVQESFGPGAEALESTATLIMGDELLERLREVTQVVDGDFFAYRNEQPDPWLTIRVVDSSVIDVTSHDSGVIQQVSKNFHLVTELPS